MVTETYNYVVRVKNSFGRSLSARRCAGRRSHVSCLRFLGLPAAATQNFEKKFRRPSTLLYLLTAYS